MRLIGYTRVSTEGQSETGLGLGDQEDKIRAYCALYGHELIEVISDPGESGATLNRPGMQEVIRRVGDDDVDGVIVSSIDRLTRDIFDMGDLLKNHLKNTTLIDVMLQLDTSTATGELMMNVILSFSQFERKRIGERTAAALAEKRRRGEYTGGGIPYGFCVEDGYLVPDHDEQDAIQMAQELYEDGVSYRAIARVLARRGYTNRSGKPFHHAQVKRLVNSTHAFLMEVA